MADNNPYSASQVTEHGQPWIRTKLGVMMFLQIAIWGAWLPSSYGVFNGLGFTSSEQTLIAECFPVAAILAMFLANQWVDRVFAAEKFLAFSHLVGGLAIMGFGVLARQHFQSLENLPVGAARPTANFWLFFVLMAVHCFFYVPTMTVTNKIAFANLKNPAKDFGPVRLWGTIGWIAVAWPFVFILTNWAVVNDKLPAANNLTERLGIILGTPVTGNALDVGRSWAFILAGGLSLLLAAFSLTLPHTPPQKVESGEKRFAWLEALQYLQKPYILILFIVTWIDATVHDGFFVFAFDYLAHVGVPSNWVLPAMTIGQIAEIVTMAILGLVLKNLGWRWTMVIGILGHAARFLVFAYMPDAYAAVGINVVHGICYAFFFATVYIFVDEVFPADARASAQGLFNLLIFGLGPITARYLWPAIRDSYATVTPATTTMPEVKTFDYPTIFLYPSGLAIIAACLLAFLFHPPSRGPEGEVKH